MKIKAIGRKLVVKTFEEEKKEGKIIIEKTEGVKKRDRGIVTSIGKDVEEISIGDIVTFNVYSGMEMEEDGEEYIMLNFDEIYAILEK